MPTKNRFKVLEDINDDKTEECEITEDECTPPLKSPGLKFNKREFGKLKSKFIHFSKLARKPIYFKDDLVKETAKKEKFQKISKKKIEGKIGKFQSQAFFLF